MINVPSPGGRGRYKDFVGILKPGFPNCLALEGGPKDVGTCRPMHLRLLDVPLLCLSVVVLTLSVSLF